MADFSPIVQSILGRLTGTKSFDHGMEVSRHELTKLLEKWRRDIEEVPDPLSSMNPRRRAIVQAAAAARVLSHPKPWTDPASLLPFWGGPGNPPTESQMRRTAKEAKACIPYLKDLDHEVAPWTGGFWQGLRMSGALLLHGGHPRLQAGRPWLEEDLERLPFPGRLSPRDNQGRRWLIRCHVWRLPVSDSLGPDVLAGLLAGARREEAVDGTWLVVPRTESVLKLIDFWKLSVVKGSRDNELRISPFYGAVLSGNMPVACASSMLVRKAGGCPLLPMAIWEVLWGPAGADLGYIMPDRAWAIPFICGAATRSRRGWTRDFLHRAAVALGVAHVVPEMAKILKEWRNR